MMNSLHSADRRYERKIFARKIQSDFLSNATFAKLSGREKENSQFFSFQTKTGISLEHNVNNRH